MRSRLSTVMLLLLAPVLLIGAARSGEEEWERLTAESLRLYEAGEYEEAILMSREALEAAAEALGPRHPVTGKSMNNLGAMLAERGDTDEAEEVLAGALSILEESLGTGHPGTSSALNNLAELYAAQGKPARAEDLFLRALSIRRGAPGEDGADLVTTMSNLAALYAKTDRFRESEALYREMLELEGEAAADLLHLYLREGNLYREQGRPGDAAAAYEKALETADRFGVHVPSDDGSLRETIAALRVSAGELEGAALWYEKALKALPEDEGEALERTRLTRDLARVYMRMKRYEEAVAGYGEALEIQERNLDAGDPDIGRSAVELAAALSALAKARLDSGGSEEAAALLERSIELRERYGERDEASLAIRLNNLAGILTGLERFDEAERHYSRALEILERTKGGKDADYLVVLGNLRQLYLLSGDGEKAAAVDSLTGGR